MTMYFSSKNIPELSQYSSQERQAMIAKAQQQFTAPEKLILNLLKLGMLTPPFLFLARQEWRYLALTLVISLMVYVLIARPLTLAFCRKYLSAIT